MRILTLKSNMLVIGMFSDNERVILGKDRIDTNNKDFGNLNRDTVRLYNSVKILPDFNVVNNYTFDGDTYMKIHM